MAWANFEGVFEGACQLSYRTVLTVTEAPEHEEELLEMLERALMRGLNDHLPLAEIHLPFVLFPRMNSKFWHIPVEDSGDSKLVRFFFEVPPVET